jgi:methionine-rich copper-binding protein CopC
MKRIFVAMLLVAPPAMADAKLKSSDPAANASVKSPNLIRLVFSEPLEPASSGAQLTDAMGKTVPLSSSVGGLTITLIPLGLRPGAYKVIWHSVTRAAHRAGGSFAFKVVP